MKRHYFKLLSAVFCLALAGCSQEGDFSKIENPDSGSEGTRYKVTLSEALNRADAVLARLDGPGTRMARSVKEVGAIRKSMTRSAASASAPDTMFYIVNYEDDRGFAILSADKRLAPIYAISDEGSFNISDTAYNVGLKQYMDGLMAINTEEIDSLPSPEPPEPQGSIISIKHTGPFLDKNVRRWGQGAPFNKFCLLKNEERTLVGCVPLAVAMVMASYEWPLIADNLP